ncbi:hypothetical protein RFI_18899 [Reticulomyxa filosa]|uniref:Uncharacterized protein n=1 Tax=Reticulomyxa filosa TaxID=46433 RepID=X6MX55_RETFI|nr:hypothetical protein RFI_18899 [Reticulomyxa filosa]|eukprot:ETO18374.1 hypothetical protein RFI_18899 [Reticulomyxa filosa]
MYMYMCVCVNKQKMSKLQVLENFIEIVKTKETAEKSLRLIMSLFKEHTIENPQETIAGLISKLVHNVTFYDMKTCVCMYICTSVSHKNVSIDNLYVYKRTWTTLEDKNKAGDDQRQNRENALRQTLFARVTSYLFHATNLCKPSLAKKENVIDDVSFLLNESTHVDMLGDSTWLESLHESDRGHKEEDTFFELRSQIRRGKEDLPENYSDEWMDQLWNLWSEGAKHYINNLEHQQNTIDAPKYMGEYLKRAFELGEKFNVFD